MANLASLKIAIDSGDIAKAQKELNALGNSAGNTEKQTKSLSSSFSALGTIITAGAIYGLTREFIKIADSMTNVNSQLKLVTKNTQELASAQKALFDIAQRTRQGYAETASTYSNFALSMGEMGKSQKDILRVTETVNKAIAISGGTAQQAAAATMQLGQAFASGVLRGDELNSILENSKGLAQAIADGMGVPIGKLRQLGSEGKITAEILAKALENSANSVDSKFSKTDSIIEQSMTKMNNQIAKSVEEFDKMNGVSAKVSGTIQSFTKYIAENGDALNDLTRYTKDAIVAGTTLYGSVMAVETIMAIRTAMGELTLAQYAFNVAAKANPYIIAGTVVAGAVTYLYDQMQQSQDEYNKKIAKGTASQAKYNEELNTTGGKARSLGASYNSLSNALSNMEKQRKNAVGEQAKNLDKSILSVKNQMASIQQAAKELGKVTDTKIKPLVDTTAKAKKEKKQGKSDAEKAIEEEAKQTEKIRHALSQSEMSNISKITIARQEAETDHESAQIQADSDNQIRKQALMDSWKSELELLNEKVINDYNFALAMFPEGIPEEFFKSLNDSFDKLAQDAKSKLDFSASIEFDPTMMDGVQKGVAGIAKSMKALEKEDKQYNKNKTKYAKNSVEYAENEEDHTKSQIAGYANMAGAASAMFEQGSKEAQLMTTIQAGLAMVNAVSGIAKQASLPFPYNIAAMAGTAATVFSFLSSAGISGGSASSTPPPDATMGTVLGAGAYGQSESITNITSLMEDIHASEYSELRSINKAVTSMARGIEGAVTNLFRSGALDTSGVGLKSSNGSAYAIGSALAGKRTSEILPGSGIMGASAELTGKLFNFVFGGSSKQSIKSSGIDISAGTLAQKAGGDVGASSFIDIETKKRKMWGSTSYSFNKQNTALDTASQSSISLIYQSFNDTMQAINKGLDTSLEKSIGEYVFQATTLNLKGLSGEDATKKLNDYFSAQGDKMVNNIFGDLIGKYQQLGEGLLETAVRVIAGKEIVMQSLADTGFDTSKFKRMGEIVTTEMVQIGETITRSFWGERSFTPIMAELTTVKIGLIDDTVAITQSILEMSGGIEQFQESFGSYYDKYFTDLEKQTNLTRHLSEAFEAFNRDTTDLGEAMLDLNMPATTAGFRGLVESLDLTTEEGQKAYTMIMSISGAFYEMATFSDDVKDSIIDLNKVISEFVKSLRSDITSQSAVTSFKTFSTSFNEMVDAIASGSDKIMEVGQTAIENAKLYIASVTSTATSSRDIAFAKSMIANKFENVTLAPNITMGTINDTLKFSLNENSAIVMALNNITSQLDYLNSLNTTQTATSVRTLNAIRATITA